MKKKGKQPETEERENRLTLILKGKTKAAVQDKTYIDEKLNLKKKKEGGGGDRQNK